MHSLTRPAIRSPITTPTFTPARARITSTVLPALLLLALALATTFAVSWSLAAWLPHDNLLYRHNVISQPGLPGAAGKPVPRYIAVNQYSRSGMARRAWNPGFFGRTQLDTDLKGNATIALKLPTANQDRSWGTLPLILNAPDYSKISAGGEDARGWPFLALWCRVDEAAPTGHTIRGGIPLSPSTSTTGAARALPYLPIWQGLILNTLIYAAAWLAISFAFRTWRALLRRRRNHCPRCNYDLRDAPGRCPECGRAESRRVRANRSRPRRTESHSDSLNASK